MTEHFTSMAVWAVPSPVVVDRPFRVHVGLRCSDACRLRGKRVKVLDDAGMVVGQAQLTDTTWPGTEALYWAEVQLTAPRSPGVNHWTAVFPGDDASSTHPVATTPFSFRVAPAPEHRLTIHVIDKATGAPVPDVEIRLGPYQLSADQRGQATTTLAAGSYLLDIRKDGYAADATTVRVAGDSSVRVEASPAPTAAEMIARMERYEDVWGVTNWRAKQLPIASRGGHA